VKVRKTRKGKVTGTADKVLKSAIQKVIKGDSETKYVAEACRNLSTGNTLATFTAFSSAITGVAEIYAAIPRTHQGVDEHERIGDTIMPTSCRLHLDFASTGFGNNQSEDKVIHVFLCNAVAVKQLDNYSAIPITALLNDGAGANVGFDGTVLRQMMPVNKKNFQVISHRRFKLVKGFGKAFGSSASDPAGLTDSTITPVDASYKSITLNVKLPKKVKYDTHNSRYPANAAPFFVIGWTRRWPIDAASNVIDTQVMGRVEMYYKDV